MKDTIAELRRLDPMSAVALERIARERLRQLTAENWTTQHDDQATEGQMASAAAAYAHYAGQQAKANTHGNVQWNPPWWPWLRHWWKPRKPYQNLNRAGALLVAEIARRLRKATKELDAEGVEL